MSESAPCEPTTPVSITSSACTSAMSVAVPRLPTIPMPTTSHIM